MMIEFEDGRRRYTANDPNTIAELIRDDVGPDAVIFDGLVWATGEEAENDDGARAVARLFTDEGSKFRGDLEDL